MCRGNDLLGTTNTNKNILCLKKIKLCFLREQWNQIITFLYWKTDKKYLPIHYDDVDILPSSSLFDESYPEFYGDQCLSKQFLWNFLLEVVKPVSILDLKIWLNLFVDKMALVGACRKTHNNKLSKFFFQIQTGFTCSSKKIQRNC